jgi:hypothetical protein
MNTESTKTFQSNYTLSILNQEYQQILDQHPLDISMDGFNWMMLGLEQVWKCLDTIKNQEEFDNILTAWYRQTKLIEKFAAIRKIEFTNTFLVAKQEIEHCFTSMMQSHHN